MKYVVVLVVALHAQIGFAATPRLFTDDEVSPLRIAEAVNHFVELGEEPAVAELKRSWEQSKRNSPDSTIDLEQNERMLWVCRVLFDPKGVEPIPGPALGEPSLPFRKLSDSHWPRFPLVQTGASYFVLTRFVLDGVPETVPGYLEQCRKQGTFRKTKVPLPTRAQVIEDAAALRRSPEWTTLKWTEKKTGGPDDEWEFQRIKDQAENVD